MDINVDGVNSTDSEVYTWLSEHAREYGSILRYPKNKIDITGTDYGPWHYRYAKTEAVAEIHKKGLYLEEHLAQQQP